MKTEGENFNFVNKDECFSKNTNFVKSGFPSNSDTI